jgi:gluconolactonase
MKRVAHLASVLAAVLLVSFASFSTARNSAAGQAATHLGNIERRDARLDKLVPKNAKLEKLGDGYHWVEGPVWNRKENHLLFSDIPANAIIKWKAGEGCGLYFSPSGYTGSAPFEGREPGSNGLTYDTAGRLVLCEHGDRRVARLEKDGLKTTLADRYDGHRLNSPNDLAFKSNGDLYFTDPAYGLPKTFDDPQRELPFCGVYRLSKDGKMTLLIKDLQAPNGIAFSPDEKRLYVSDSAQGLWMVYDVKPDGTLAEGRVFFDAKPWTKTRKGAPDGLKVDKQGNLFASGPEGIYVFAADGTHLGTIETGVPTANCAWGDDGSTLYITANTTVYRIRLTTRGAGF